jgi:16S rRNA (adenine1518-N6/adenine1519-N6)-dimethyltransferase
VDATYTDPAQVLARAGVRARRSLSQNFLVDSLIARQIVEALPATPGQLVEVGAGPGTMTRALTEGRDRVVAIELDDRMVPLLERAVRGLGVEVVHGDALEVDIPAHVEGAYAVFGNIPYHITGLLVPRLLALDPRPQWVCVLVQLEVAQRLSAEPGDWSLATLGVRVSATAELLLRVPARAFDPAPKVDSALVMLRPGPESAFADSAFFDFARAIFQERRKKLPNAVANAMGHDVEGARAVVEKAGLDPMRRPQTLNLADWEALYRAYRDVV